MASRIEHQAKAEAYENCKLWEAGMKDDDSPGWFATQKVDAHRTYLQEMRKKRHWLNRDFYGNPPRNRFFNWLGHRLIDWAWRENVGGKKHGYRSKVGEGRVSRDRSS